MEPFSVFYFQKVKKLQYFYLKKDTNAENIDLIYLHILLYC